MDLPPRRGPGRPRKDEPREDVTPLLAGRFGEVVETIHSNGRVKGFERARDTLFSAFEVFSQAMPAYSVLKLCLEMDRHAMFCEVHAERQRAAADANVWGEYQKYLAGETDVAPAVGVGAQTSVEADGIRVRVDDADQLADDTEREMREDG